MQPAALHRGSLVMRLPDSDHADIPTLLFGTVNGVIGVLASLPQDQFEFLRGLQKALNKVVSGVGGLSHEQWRSFHNEHRGRTSEARNYVDGDLVESFLDLRREKALEVAALVSTPLDELTERVEELVRLTH
jgi:DNA damage-binding protein 1